MNEYLGKMVRDRRSGVVGKVIGHVEWLDGLPSLIVQPPVRNDQTVPPTVYVPQSSAEVVPQLNEPRIQ